MPIPASLLAPMISDLVGSAGSTQMAGSSVVPPLATGTVSTAALASPVGWTARAGTRKAARLATRARTMRAATVVRRDIPGSACVRDAGIFLS
jgi:hypothetical protein